MAVIDFSGIGVTDIAGSVGGSTFQRGKAGNTLKRKSRPGGNKSAGQQGQQAVVSQLSTRWKELTAEQRLGWNAAAASGEWNGKNKLGNTTTLSGFQLFMEVNTRLEAIDEAMVSDAPAKQPMPPVTWDSVIFDYSNQVIDINTTGSLLGCTITVFATACHGAGIAKPKFFKVIEKVWSVDGQITLIGWINVFGIPIMRSFVGFRLRLTIQATGQVLWLGEKITEVV